MAISCDIIYFYGHMESSEKNIFFGELLLITVAYYPDLFYKYIK